VHQFIDKEDYLRVAGSLQHSCRPYDSKHQPILPHTHQLTELIIMNEYLGPLHACSQRVSASLRQQYLVPGIKESHSSSVALLLVVSQIKGSSLTAVDGLVTFG